MDITVNKFLGIAILYYSGTQGKIISTYLDMPVLAACNATAITESMKHTLSNYNLPLKKLVGIGTDNASVMVGVNNGVAAKLRKDVPNLVLVRCLCHSLQLAVSAASSETLPRNLEYLISETYNWFSRSSGRQLAYHQLYALLNDGDNPLQMVQACETRWLSIELAVTRIVDQWLELRTHFDLARQGEKCYLTDTLSNMYNNDCNHAYFTYVSSVLKELQLVNKSFQLNKKILIKINKHKHNIIVNRQSIQIKRNYLMN